MKLIKIIAILLMSTIALLPSIASAYDTTLAEFEPNTDIDGNQTFSIFNKNIAGQTFVANSVYEISRIRIYGYVVQSAYFEIEVQLVKGDGTVIASAHPTDQIAYHPLIGDKSIVKMNSAYFSSDGNGSWMDCDLDHSVKTNVGEIYAVRVLVKSGSATNNFNWFYNDGGSQYSNGAACTSANNGATWAINTDDTFMFELWGESGLLINDVKAFNSFREDGDWLIVFSYKNVAQPYYPDGNIEQLFRVRLTDNDTGNISAENVLRYWDAGVGSIYMNADEVTDIEWEWGNFTLSVVATYGTGFSVSYDLPPGNATVWQGSNLIGLDTWCIATAKWIGHENRNDENYYLTPGGVYGFLLSTEAKTLNDYVAQNDKGGIGLFERGIPGLGNIRGSTLYEVYSNVSDVAPTPTPNPELQSHFIWTDQLGTELSDALGDVATPFHLSGKEMALLACLAIYVMVVGSSFPVGHGLAGTIAGFFIVGIGMYAGVVDFVWVFMAGAFLLLMALRQLILVGQ